MTDIDQARSELRQAQDARGRARQAYEAAAQRLASARIAPADLAAAVASAKSNSEKASRLLLSLEKIAGVAGVSLAQLPKVAVWKPGAAVGMSLSQFNRLSHEKRNEYMASGGKIHDDEAPR